jgi:hypothetical protein
MESQMQLLEEYNRFTKSLAGFGDAQSPMVQAFEHKDGQITVLADPPRRGMDPVKVVVSLVDRQNDSETHQKFGHGARRRQQMLRICQEAADKNVALKQYLLGLLLGCTKRVVGMDLAYLKKLGIHVHRHGCLWPKGNKLLPLRVWAPHEWLLGRSPEEIAVELEHAPALVDGLLKRFTAFVYLTVRFGPDAGHATLEMTEFEYAEAGLLLQQLQGGKFPAKLETVVAAGAEMVREKKLKPMPFDPLAKFQQPTPGWTP